MTDESDPVEHTGGESVRDAVLHAFEKHGVEVPEEARGKSAQPEPDAAESIEAKADRARDERGRFAPKTEAAPEKAAPVEEPSQIPGTDKPDEKPAQASTPEGGPASWPADAKTEWSKLSPAIQAAVIKRENEINEGGRRWSEDKRRYEETLTPLRTAAQRYGLDERQGLQRLLAANEYLERDPVNALRWLAQHHNVDLQQLAAAPAQVTPRVDPVVQAMHRELNQLKQTITTREQEEIESEISRFAKDKPHFKEVKVTMGRLMETGEAQSLEDAYEKACYTSPDVREKLIAERLTAQQTERANAERERVAKARRGAVSISGSPSGGPVSKPNGKGSVRDDVLSAWNQHMG